jgi:hypothetical protein
MPAKITHREETMKRRHLPITIVFLAVLAASCSTTTTDAEGQITEPFTRVVVSTGAGNVQIERTTGTPDWLAEATFSGDEPDFTPKVVDGELIVDEGCEGIGECSVDYLIAVPEGTEVVARSGSGDVTVTSISAAVDVETGSGVVFLNTVKGPIMVETGSGDILATKLEAAQASFESGSGSVDVAFELIITDLRVNTGSGNVTAQLAGGPYDLDLDTGSGNIDLKLDDDDTASYKVELNTGSGDITVYKQ